MHQHALYALANPVFDPDRDMAKGGYGWRPDRHVSASLTANIGME